MNRLQGMLGLLVIYGLCFAISRHRSRINWRTLGIGFALQVGFALVVLKWEPGREALRWFADLIAKLIGYTTAGTEFLFGSLAKGSSVPFAIAVLPVIIFLGALVGLLYYLRVIQWVVSIVGGAISRLLATSRVESIWATTVIFLGQSEAPLLIAPYLKRLTRSELFTCMTGGFASVAGSTLVGYSLLGAPLPYLLAASVMNAPAMLVIAKAIYPETEKPEQEGDVRSVRDTESANAIDSLARGALSGGRLAVIVGCLLIAFVALIALANGILGLMGSWFGIDDLTFQRVLGWIFAPVAWLIGVPWDEASTVGSLLGQKTVINEFVAYASFGPQIPSLEPKTVLITTFALAGFANFGSIAIQLGSFGALAPERRADVARLGLLALLAGTLANLSNAAIVGIVG
ncbi:NupC/NupG family nucleoside CNT transporter [Streptomyces erythrochromogenes]|uniref:NupC/NupG family nucleoside CNT transporter n=1 Tax=Streptomyces erythrochromogenes TaxID=285574 RepID=UPI00367DAC48